MADEIWLFLSQSQIAHYWCSVQSEINTENLRLCEDTANKVSSILVARFVYLIIWWSNTVSQQWWTADFTRNVSLTSDIHPKPGDLQVIVWRESCSSVCEAPSGQPCLKPEINRGSDKEASDIQPKSQARLTLTFILRRHTYPGSGTQKEHHMASTYCPTILGNAI